MIFTGSAVALVTPFNEDNTPNFEKIKEIIETNGGVVTKVDAWGNRKLAYPIAKFTEGFYTLVNFKASVELPKELDRNLKINENVIRHMVVVCD